MICKKCGNNIDSETKFCKYCGTPTHTLEKGQKLSSETRICPACGMENKKEYTFCVNCGSDMNNFSSESKKQAISRKRKGKKKWLLIVVFAGFMIVGAISFVMWDHQKNSNMDEREETAEESSDEEAEVEENSVDVEKELEPIEETVKEIRTKIADSQYDEKVIDEGLTVYYDNDELQAMITSGDDAYDSREYYFDGNQLIYAEFSGEENQCLYFENERLLCWDNEISGQIRRVTKYDGLDSGSQFFAWETETLSSADALLADISRVAESEQSDFVLEDSDSRLIGKEELENLTQEELKLARNEIYARHGYAFADENLKHYFEQFVWYQPTIEPEDFQESMLNAFEVYNRDLIVERETELGYR